MTTFDEKTKIPLGLAASILGAIVGATAVGAFWLATFIGSVSVATNKNVEQDEAFKAQAEVNKSVVQILTKNASDLRVIKNKLKIKD